MANYWLLIPWIERLSRWFIAGVMIFGAVPKLSDPVAFSEIVGAYGLLPDFLVFPAAWALPLVELTAAFLLIKGRSPYFKGAHSLFNHLTFKMKVSVLIRV